MKGCYSKYMLSHHKFIGILSILVLSIVLSAYVVQKNAKKCMQTDPIFCSFLADVDTTTFQHTHGIFTTEQGAREVKVDWVLNGETKQIKVITSGVETMNMIATETEVYVKDYRDGLWWQQPRKETEQYIVKFEFDPEFFIHAVIERLKDPNMKITKLAEVPCNASQCIRYAIGQELETNAEYVDISRGHAKMERYVGKKGQNTIAFNVHYEPMQIIIPEGTKQATKGQNIFLEQQLSAPVDQPAENLDFVQEFEQEMRQTERSN